MCKGVACDRYYCHHDKFHGIKTDQYHLKGKRCYKIEVMIDAIPSNFHFCSFYHLQDITAIQYRSDIDGRYRASV